MLIFTYWAAVDPLTPVKASSRKNRPLGRLHHPVQLLVKLVGCVGLAADSSVLDNTSNNGIPSSPAVCILYC